MREAFNVPDEDRFMIVTEHDDDSFIYSSSYLDIVFAQRGSHHHSDHGANDTRTVEQKKAFFARTAALLADNPGLRKEDLFINLVEVRKENWSFGNGVAQYA